MRYLRSPIVSIAIAMFAICDAALIIFAAYYRPPTWQREPRLTFVSALRPSPDHLASNVDGVFIGDKQLMFGSDRRVRIDRNQGFDVRGWAFDATLKQPFAALLMSVDRGAPAPVPYGVPRADVASVMKCEACIDSGFRIAFLPGELRVGLHTIRFRYVTPNEDAAVDSEPLAIEVR
jgi:hypothetical protein